MHGDIVKQYCLRPTCNLEEQSFLSTLQSILRSLPTIKMTSPFVIDQWIRENQ